MTCRNDYSIPDEICEEVTSAGDESNVYLYGSRITNHGRSSAGEMLKWMPLHLSSLAGRNVDVDFFGNANVKVAFAAVIFSGSRAKQDNPFRLYILYDAI